MTSSIGFPPATIYSVTGISNSFPGVVTLSSVNQTGYFYIVNGMTVTISNVKGMHQVNRQRYIVAGLDSIAKTFMLYDNYFKPVDTTNFNTYTTGGEVNIISYPPQAGSPPGLMYNTQPINI